MPLSKAKKSDQEGSTDGNIVVTAQQSRFHEIDDPSSKDIEINNLSIVVGKREILQQTRLVLKTGIHYVFVGRNGLGKSTVLKALAERRVPGIAPNLRMLLLDQTMIEKSQKDGLLEGKQNASVLENVVASDRLRQRLLDDSASLSAVLQTNQADTTKVVSVHRRLRLEQAQRDLEQAHLVAQHRSGARGSKARQVVLKEEAAVKEAEDRCNSTVETEDTNDELEAAVQMLETMQITLDAMGSTSMDARARKALIGLGFSTEQIEGPMSKLSGGWQTRAALAGALIQKTDLLMLDEPTNFLDLPAVIWLQHYLNNDLHENTTLIVTTHDRDFADAIAERLLILKVNPPCTLETFNGTLSDYYAETSRQIRRMTKMSAALEQKKAHMQSTIQKSTAAAKKSGDDKKLKQAASRKKKLEERTGLEVSAKGTRFKLNRDLVGFHTTARAGIDIPDLDPPVNMAIPSEPPDLRNETGSLVSLENVTFTYKKSKSPTLNNITLVIHPGSRTALVGLNGSGKSTLVNTITSDFSSPSTSPGRLTGTLTHHPQARIAHYTQHSTTSLLVHAQSNPNLTALSHLQTLHPSIPEQPLRALLSGLSLPATSQANTPLRALSGGQLVRVALAETLLPTPPHLLILDEPTTHLDADSIVALIKALKRYSGAILVVSHDRSLVRCVVEGHSIAQASHGRNNDRGADGDGEDEDDESTSGSEDEGGSRGPGKVYRLTRTSGRMILLERGMDEYEEVVVRQLAKQGVEV